ncbi:MAG: hypothetical protein P4L87_03510, partial [Formivibrio sp.]|nr:hypothetical protein [Formivibrio sp.]
MVTVYAADLAGNLTMTNFALTVDYSGKTNPPIFNLIWPQNGDQVSGDQFTLTGKLEDWTATVTASLVDTNGTTNSFTGLVERNGNVWIEDLSLNPGTNLITVTATDAANNIFTTNVTIVNLPTALTINPLSGDQLNGVTLDNVSGTINVSGYTVWVNGVNATQDGSGNWNATNVSIGTGGTAVIQARAIPNSDNGGYGSFTQSVNPNSPDSITAQTQTNTPTIVYMAYYDGDYNCTETVGPRSSENALETTHFVSQFATNSNGTNGGSGSFGSSENDVTYGYNVSDTYVWPSDIGPVTKSMTVTYAGTNWWNTYWLQTNIPVAGTYQASGDVLTKVYGGAAIFGGMVAVIWSQPAEHYSYTDNGAGLVHTWDTTRNYTSELRLRTGGKATPQRQNLFAIHASATAYPNLDPAHDGLNSQAAYWNDFYPQWGAYTVTPAAIRVLGKQLGADGNLYTTLPDGADISVMPIVAAQRYTASVGARKYKLHIVVNGTTPLAEDRIVRDAYFCVGQKLTFQAVFSPDVPNLNYASPIWNYTADYINNHWTDANGCEEYNIAPIPAMSNPTTAWFYNKQTQDVTANLGMYCKFNNGQSVYLVRQGKFNVFTPSISFAPGHGAEVEVRHGTYLNSAAVLFGVGDEYGGGAMQFSGVITTIPKFPGQAMATQLINRQASIDGIPFGTGGTNELDNSEIYPDSQTSLTNDPAHPNFNPLGVVDFSDQPAIPITVASWAPGNDHFNTFFRFKPDGDSDNIYVTLGRADWDWHGYVEYTGGIPYNPWTLSNWTISGGVVGGPTFNQVNDFPIWPA